MSELPFGYQHNIDQLLNLGAVCLGVGEHLADEVYSSLHLQCHVGLFALDN